jgi:FAD/FMN-containing dehydrogenase
VRIGWVRFVADLGHRAPDLEAAIRARRLNRPKNLPDDVVFPFNLIRIPASNDVAGMEQMIAQNRALYDRIRDAGGVQYPVGAFPMSHDWKDHFGSSWPRLREAKRRNDPNNLLTPGYNVFRS